MAAFIVKSFPVLKDETPSSYESILPLFVLQFMLLSICGRRQCYLAMGKSLSGYAILEEGPGLIFPLSE